MPIGGRNSIFRKPLGTGSGSVGGALKDISKSFKTEIDKVDKLASNLTADLSSMTVGTLSGFSGSLADLAGNFERELKWIEEDIESEVAQAKANLAAEANRINNKIEDQAKRLRRDIERMERPIDIGIGRIPGPDLGRYKRQIDNELTKAKRKVDDALTRGKEDIDKRATELLKNAKRELEAAKAEVDEAIEASKTYFEAKIDSLGDTLSEAEKRIAEGKYIDAIWHTTTEPLKDESRNVATAVSRSRLLNQIASTAATAYGGPAGAAAYSAWLTYETTGDLGAAIRVGIGAGVTAYATQGASDISGNGITAEAKKILLKATINASAIAASGGSQKDIENAFMKTAEAEELAAGQTALTKYADEQIQQLYPEVADLERKMNSLRKEADDLTENLTNLEEEWEEIEARTAPYIEIVEAKNISPQATYYVNFYGYEMNVSEKSLGHVFVGLVQQDGEHIISDLRMGFYPKNMPISLEEAEKGITPGEIKSDDETKYDFQYSKQVNAEYFARANARLKEWTAQSRNYKLFSNDCVAFLMDMALAAGLTPPKRRYWQADISEFFESQKKSEHLHYLRLFLDPNYEK